MNAMGNGSCDFDPLIMKGMRLLMSKREESAAELRQLFDEAVAQRRKMKGESLAAKSSVLAGASSKPGTSTSSFGPPSMVRPDGKRALDNTGGDVKGDVKRPKLDLAPKQATEGVKLPQISPNNDREEFAMDYVLEKLVGLVCEVCNKAEPTQMLECNSCRKTFHQACHQPNAVGKESYDPRHVWFCSNCKPGATPAISASPSTSAAKSSSSGREREKSSKGGSSSHSSKHKKSSSSGVSKHASHSPGDAKKNSKNMYVDKKH